MIEIRVNLGEFRRNLEKYRRETGRDIGQVIRQQARLLCVRLVHLTKPYGSDEAVAEKSKKRIEGDVRYLATDINLLMTKIAASSQKWCKNFVKAEKNGRADINNILWYRSKWAKMVKVPAFTKEMHQANRKDGKVRNLHSNQRTIVMGGKSVDKYVREVVKKSGIAKGGWAGAAEELGGTRGIPRWVSRHKSHGTVRDDSNRANDPRVVLVNRVRYVDKLLTEADTQEACSRQIRDFEKHMEYRNRYNRRL